RLPARLPRLQDLEPGDLLLPLAQTPRDLAEDAPALDRPPVAPVRQRGLGGLDRGVDVARVAPGDLAERLPGRGIRRLEVASAPSGLDGAAVEVLFPSVQRPAPASAGGPAGRPPCPPGRGARGRRRGGAPPLPPHRSRLRRRSRTPRTSAGQARSPARSGH